MNILNKQWEFNQEVANVFNKHVRQSVPGYDLMNGYVGKLSQWFIQNNSKHLDLGCSTGETIFQVKINNQNKIFKSTGIDNSKDMINKARERFSDNTVFKCDTIDTHTEYHGFDLITSVLTMQFIQPCKREEIIKNIHHGMNTGGAFILCEKVSYDNPVINSMFNSIHCDFKKDYGISEEEIFLKEKSLRGVMHPWTYQKNIDVLTNAGFSQVHEFYRCGNFVGILAIK